AVWFSAPGSLPQLASRWCFAEGGIIGAEVWYHLQVVEIICRVREFLHCIFLLGGLQLSLLILQRGIRCLFFCLFLLFLHFCGLCSPRGVCLLLRFLQRDVRCIFHCLRFQRGSRCLFRSR